MIKTRELYRSPNGDRWFLAREQGTTRVFIRHEANRASGGHVADIPIDVFLRENGAVPEQQELVRLIASLVDVTAEPQQQLGGG